MHVFNSMTLTLKPEFFYQSKGEMQLMDETTLNNYLVIITSVIGIGCLLVSFF